MSDWRHVAACRDEQLHHRIEALVRGAVHWREALLVDCVHIGALLQARVQVSRR